MQQPAFGFIPVIKAMAALGIAATVPAHLAAESDTASSHAGRSLPATTMEEVSPEVGKMRFNQLQYIGTHNSYHIAPDGALVALARITDYRESRDWPADRLFQALDYTHPPLTTQLELGMRQFELDVHYDPDGGKFAQPGALRALQASKIPSNIFYDRDGRMEAPGFKVFHGGVDVMSTCLTLRDCLGELKAWSVTNPRHFPIVVQIEAKSGSKPALADAYTPPDQPPFDLSTWTALEEEIVEVVGLDSIVTPVEVRAGHDTLTRAIRENGWPTLDTMAGRFVFLLLNKKDETNSYRSATPDLTHRLFFPSLALEDRDAAWFRIPDPGYPALADVVRKGQLATVQSDTHTVESRLNRTDRRDKAFASGAHFILTDNPIPDRRFSDYQVRFGSRRYVRCNPVTFEGPCPF
ncbi:Ca2+-dependent phosphoinositide-specific phospholipase C [Erythrobacter aureus]|uniref:Calcium-dependent phosphoinositide phospholipase C n=1 Tax=Erythrobacter aureus TaxID=2182384 RepID=A0A345YB00_9SPHN|nr:Ca2+-dependent phosphoinositide-specific phospholipase C [Erythrobacter aureus]AXK41102.1 hypothetical protein DVR09_01065 [Erythrobacter aureus]